MSDLWFDEFEGNLDAGQFLGSNDLGKFHFMVDDVEDPDNDDDRQTVESGSGSYTKATSTKLVLRVLAPKSYKGRTKSWYLARTGKMARRTGQVARILGLLTDAQVEESKKTGTPVSVQWSDAIGCDFCAEIERNEYTTNEEKEKARREKRKAEPSITAKIQFNFCKAADGPQRGFPVDRSLLPGEDTNGLGPYEPTEAEPADDGGVVPF